MNGKEANKTTSGRTFEANWDPKSPLIVLPPVPHEDNFTYPHYHDVQIPPEVMNFLNLFKDFFNQSLTQYDSPDGMLNHLIRLAFYDFRFISRSDPFFAFQEKMIKLQIMTASEIATVMSFFTSAVSNNFTLDDFNLIDQEHVGSYDDRATRAALVQRLSLNMYQESLQKCRPDLTMLQTLMRWHIGKLTYRLGITLAGAFGQASTIRLLTTNGQTVYTPSPVNKHAVEKLEFKGVDLIVVDSSGTICCIDVKTHKEDECVLIPNTGLLDDDFVKYVSQLGIVANPQPNLTKYLFYIPSSARFIGGGYVDLDRLDGAERAILEPLGLHPDQNQTR